MALSFLARENNLTMAQAAFRFVLDHPSVTVALGGFSSMEQLEEIASVSGKPGFTAAQASKLEAVWRSNFGERA